MEVEVRAPEEHVEALATMAVDGNIDTDKGDAYTVTETIRLDPVFWAGIEIDLNLERDDRVDADSVYGHTPAFVYPSAEAAMRHWDRDREERNAIITADIAENQGRSAGDDDLEPPYVWEAPTEDRDYWRALLLVEPIPAQFGGGVDILHEIRIYPVKLYKEGHGA